MSRGNAASSLRDIPLHTPGSGGGDDEPQPHFQDPVHSLRRALDT